ncbi:MAG: hypothetical protein ACI8PZ_000808 [Myxococcota bacterium]|jgi:hypothetical protein
MSATVLVYDDAVGVPRDIASLTGIARFGVLLYKRKRLWEHASAAARAAGFQQRIHLQEHADRLALADELADAPAGQRYVYLSADVVSAEPELFARFLAKLSWSDDDVVSRPGGARPGSAIACFGAARLRQLMLASRSDAQREAWWSDRRDQLAVVPAETPFACLSDADMFVRFLSGSFYTRAFNAIEQSGRSIVKRSADRDKMKREHDYWYLLPPSLQRFVVQPYGYVDDGAEASYRMERLNMPDMAVLWVHGPAAVSTEALGALLDVVFDWFAARPTRSDPAAARAAAEALYVTKLDQRMAALLQLEAGQRLDRLVREGTPWDGLQALVDRYRALLDAEWARSAPEQVAVMHGDLCFSNILFDKRSRLVRFIDPRGANSEPELWGDAYYDIAKLSHSVLGGYDYVNNGLFDVHVGDALRFELHVARGAAGAREALFVERAKAAGFDPVRMRLYEASLFLSMLPLHAEDPRKLLGFVLTAGGILDEVERARSVPRTLLQRVLG